MSLYIRTRCPHCDHKGNYANDGKDTLICDHCVREFRKIDGMKLDYAPKKTKVRNELRKEMARRERIYL